VQQNGTCVAASLFAFSAVTSGTAKAIVIATATAMTMTAATAMEQSFWRGRNGQPGVVIELSSRGRRMKDRAWQNQMTSIFLDSEARIAVHNG